MGLDPTASISAFQLVSTSAFQLFVLAEVLTSRPAEVRDLQWS
jgi:hypothetical protein